MPGLTTDEVNQAVWARTASHFAKQQGWTDAGEYSAVMRAMRRNETNPLRILDIGVGGGRTTALLQPVAAEYVGVDYVPAMVEACRKRFPQATIRVGDARKLEFGANSFDLVLFSYSGLDSLGHDDRPKALAEMVRVCAPGGAVVYSTHNLAGPGGRDRPWKPGTASMGLVESGRRVKNRMQRFPAALANYRRLSALAVQREHWAMLVDMSYSFGTVQHFVDAREALGEAYDAGMVAVTLIDKRGRPLSAADHERLRGSWCFHVVGRKPAVPAPPRPMVPRPR